MSIEETREIRRTLQNLLPGSRYATRVRAVSELGQYSEWSEALEFVAEASASASYDLVAPPAPTIQPQINAITVIMNYTAENDGISTYIVEHSTDNVSFAEIVRTQIPLYVHQVPPGQTHYYRFKVIDVYGTTSAVSPSNSGQSISEVSHKPYATVVVAAHNSSAIDAENADFVCDGVDDHITINAAIAASHSSGWWGKVVLLDGDYVCDGKLDYVEVLEGAGLYATQISIYGSITGNFISADQVSGLYIELDSTASVSGYVVQGYEIVREVEITAAVQSPFGIYNGNTVTTAKVYNFGVGIIGRRVTNCVVEECNVGIEVDYGECVVTGSILGGNDTSIVLNADAVIAGNSFVLGATQQPAILIQTDDYVISSNSFYSSYSASSDIFAIEDYGDGLITANKFEGCGVKEWGTSSIVSNHFTYPRTAVRMMIGSYGRFVNNRIQATTTTVPPIRIDNDAEDVYIGLNDIDVNPSVGAFSDGGSNTAYGIGNLINGVWVGSIASTLSDLTDVDTTGVSTGDVLTFDGTEWIAGAAPSSDANYVHDQASTATTWTVTHNLGKRVSVTTIDSSSREIFGVVEWISDNQVTVTFNAATSGKAYCN